jgi:hypothetical protein
MLAGCPFQKYYPGTLKLTILRVIFNSAFPPTPSGSYIALIVLKLTGLGHDQLQKIIRPNQKADDRSGLLGER